jgi:hypothetical protein
MQIFEFGRGKPASHSTWTSFGSEIAPSLPDKFRYSLSFRATARNLLTARKISHRYAVRTPALAGGARDDKREQQIMAQIILYGSETAPGKSHELPDKINRGNVCMQGAKTSPRLTNSQRKESS